MFPPIKRFMKPDIRTVAKRAGVSIGTVSNVIHGRMSVNSEIQARVVKAIAELGYQPSRVAQGLRSKRSRTLGLILSDLHNPFFTQIAAAVETTVSQAGYDLILATSSEDIQKERRAVENLANRRVDGLIMAPSPGNHSYLREVISQGIPVVLTNRRLPDLDIPAVYADHATGSATGIEHLISHGHHRIGVIVGLRGLSSTADTLRGIRRAVKARKVPDLVIVEAESGATHEGGQKAAHDLVRGASPVTAILSLSTMATLGALMAIRRMGIGIPDDLAFIGCSDHRWCAVMDPPLTMIQQHATQIGLEAARLLLGLLTGAASPNRKPVVLPATLTIRKSCGCPTPSSGSPQDKRR